MSSVRLAPLWPWLVVAAMGGTLAISWQWMSPSDPDFEWYLVEALLLQAGLYLLLAACRPSGLVGPRAAWLLAVWPVAAMVLFAVAIRRWEIYWSAAFPAYAESVQETTVLLLCVVAATLLIAGLLARKAPLILRAIGRAVARYLRRAPRDPAAGEIGNS